MRCFFLHNGAILQILAKNWLQEKYFFTALSTELLELPKSPIQKRQELLFPSTNSKHNIES